MGQTCWCCRVVWTGADVPGLAAAAAHTAGRRSCFLPGPCHLTASGPVVSAPQIGPCTTTRWWGWCPPDHNTAMKGVNTSLWAWSTCCLLLNRKTCHLLPHCIQSLVTCAAASHSEWSEAHHSRGWLYLSNATYCHAVAGQGRSLRLMSALCNAMAQLQVSLQSMYRSLSHA